MPRDPFYNSRAWKWLRTRKLAETPICEVCRVKRAVDVDHIVAINNGGDAIDLANLRSLCHECHSKKTYYVERLGRSKVPNKAVDPKTGLPKDPDHWWNKWA